MYVIILSLVLIQSFFIQEVFSQYANFGPGVINPNIAYGDINAYGHNYGFQAGLAGLVPGLAGMTYNRAAEFAIDAARENSGYGGTGVGDIEVVGEMPVVGTTLIEGQVPVIGSVRFSGDVPATGVVSVSGTCGCGCGFGTYI